MTKDLAVFAKNTGVKYFMISYTDLFGVQRAKLVPTQAIADMQVEGAGFAGFATWLDFTPAHPDMLAVPDPSSVIQLPWKPEVAWVAANCVMEGEDVAQAPRNLLRRLIDDAGTEGMHVKTGIEAEFFLLSPDGSQISDEYDTASKPCYDQQAVMRRYDVIKEICDYMLELGWGPYQNDHEDANGQFEMNWEFDDALATADKHSFFKFMTKSVAEKHGFRATFMPKPVEGLTGNGCHAHISVWDAPGSKSKINVARGLHFQLKIPQGKYVSVIKGQIFDVAVDCRSKSKTFGKHFKILLDEKNCKSIYIPPGFAHGFLTISQYAELQYKTTNFLNPKLEKSIMIIESDSERERSIFLDAVLNEKRISKEIEIDRDCWVVEIEDKKGFNAFENLDC